MCYNVFMKEIYIVRTFRTLKTHAHYKRQFAKIGAVGQKFCYDFLIKNSEIDTDFGKLASEINKISLMDDKPSFHRDIIELLSVTNQIQNKR